MGRRRIVHWERWGRVALTEIGTSRLSFLNLLPTPPPIQSTLSPIQSHSPGFPWTTPGTRASPLVRDPRPYLPLPNSEDPLLPSLSFSSRPHTSFSFSPHPYFPLIRLPRSFPDHLDPYVYFKRSDATKATTTNSPLGSRSEPEDSRVLLQLVLLA